MTKIDLRSQVQGVLPVANGGTDTTLSRYAFIQLWNDSGGTLAQGTLVTKTAALPNLHATTIAAEPIIGIVVGSFPTAGGALVVGDCASDTPCAIAISGYVYLQTTAGGTVGQYLSTSGTAGKAVPATTKAAGAWGRVIQSGDSGSVYGLLGEVGSSVEPSYAVPAIVLGTAAAAGAASTVIRSDSTIVAFDVTVPSTQAIGDAAATGSAAVASRRDHKHAMPAFAAPAIVHGTSAAAGSAATLVRTDATIVTFDVTTPTTQALGDSPATGSAAVAARRDHRHGMPSAAVGELLISDTPSTPLIFADILQNEAQDDLLYAD